MFHKYVIVSGVSIHLLNSVMGLLGGTCSSQLGLVFLQLEWKIKMESVFSFLYMKENYVTSQKTIALKIWDYQKKNFSRFSLTSINLPKTLSWTVVI